MLVGISGLSVWTCFGRGPEPLSEAMASSDRRFEQVSVAADIDDPWFKTKRGMQLPIPTSITSSWRGRELPVTPFDWPAQFAIETALDAVVDAGRVTQRYPSERIAVCNGTSHGSNHGLLEYLRQIQADEPSDPSLLLDLPSIIAARIARTLGASGPSLTFNTACSAGLNAIGQGVRLIESGRADCVIAGGHDTFSLLSFAGFTSLKALDPEGARPFDINRDGLSLGDGAAYVVLERGDAIRNRGASDRGPGRGWARAWIGGYAYLGEAYHPTAPDPEGRGVERAMRQALSEVANPERLTLVSAHGTGTPANDEAELRAIGRVAEAINVSEPVDVVSLKAQTGHTLGAAGAVQSVAAILNMERGLVPANITLDQPVSHGPKLRLPTQPTAREIPVAVCNGLGFGGSVAALALVHPEYQP